MDQEGALRFLGLFGDPTPGDIEVAYTKRSVVLKRRLVESQTVGERNRHRRALKNLVLIRDLALGPEGASARRARRLRQAALLLDDWWSPQRGVPVGIHDRERALAFFGLDRRATPEQVRQVFHARSRALKRCIAHARNDERLERYRDALVRLNDLLRLALESEPENEVEVVEAPPEDESSESLEQTMSSGSTQLEAESTLTDVNLFFQAAADAKSSPEPAAPESAEPAAAASDSDLDVRSFFDEASTDEDTDPEPDIWLLGEEAEESLTGDKTVTAEPTVVDEPAPSNLDQSISRERTMQPDELSDSVFEIDIESVEKKEKRP